MVDRVYEDFSLNGAGSRSWSSTASVKAWLPNLLLLLATLVSTTVFGYALTRSFAAGRPLDEADWLLGFQLMLSGNSSVWSGLAYSLPLLLILLSHEMGHYILCQRWGVAATLPYFGPSPTLLGTVGAFIWIRSPIFRRKALFDVGISGPILGFAVLLPFLIFGMWNSKLVPNLPGPAQFTFGTPLLIRALEALRFPGVAPGNICLHPTAMAAWAGLLATAINLLPIGQLDGGHIIYAVVGEQGHRIVSWIVISLLTLGGLLYWPWWVWAAVMFFFKRHPLIHDPEPLGRPRQCLCGLAILLLFLSFSIVPVRAG